MLYICVPTNLKFILFIVLHIHYKLELGVFLRHTLAQILRLKQQENTWPKKKTARKQERNLKIVKLFNM